MQTYRGELVNNLGKLSELDKMISSEETKLKGLAEDNENRTSIEKSLRDLRDEQSARLKATLATYTALRSQISRIKETINRILTGDTTLAERIKDLFRSEGVTIFSILTALGLAISTLIFALTGGSCGGGGAAASTSKPTPEPAPEPARRCKWMGKNKIKMTRQYVSMAGW